MSFPHVYLKSYGGKDNNLLPLSGFLAKHFAALLHSLLIFHNCTRYGGSTLTKLSKDVRQFCAWHFVANYTWHEVILNFKSILSQMFNKPRQLSTIDSVLFYIHIFTEKLMEFLMDC